LKYGHIYVYLLGEIRLAEEAQIAALAKKAVS
jgi:hypothetical protein